MLIGDLLTLMPPHAGAGVDVDWEAAERAWGTPFPMDYKEFVHRYGGGAIENFVGIFEPSLDASGQPTGAMADETSVAQEFWEELEGLPGVDVESDRILAWAADATADVLCWLRVGDDPDTWPVVVYERGMDAWQLYACGMVEFLLRVFRADFPQNPLSGTPMWGVSDPRFLTSAERRRIAATGRDPWA